MYKTGKNFRNIMFKLSSSCPDTDNEQFWNFRLAKAVVGDIIMAVIIQKEQSAKSSDSMKV